MKKARMGMFGILAAGAVLLALLIVTGSTTLAREAESGGGASSGSSSGSGHSGGGNSGRDSARDIEERGARSVTADSPAVVGASTSTSNPDPVQNTQRPASPPASPATVPAQVNFSETDTGIASASDTSDLDEIIDLIERIRTLMEREGISFSDLGFDVDDSDVPDESDESGFDSARDTEERAALPVAMRISIEKNNDF